MKEVHQRPISRPGYLTASDLTNLLTWAKIISKERVWSKADSRLSMKLVQEKKRLTQLNYLKQKANKKSNKELLKPYYVK